MLKTCKKCESSFEVTDEDLKFYDHISPVLAGQKCPIPPPTFCPLCRLRRRFVFRNHISLFYRPAHPDGKLIYSMYPETVPFPVMRNEDWFGDNWDPLTYGQDFSFERSFFEQFHQLNSRTPKYARLAVRNENCDYCNNLSDNKNCYLVFNTSTSEDCLYSDNCWGTKDGIDCSLLLQSERCYDCLYCVRCYNLQSSECCENCSDSFFLAFCRSCRNCFGCVNLRSRQYCIFNEKKTKEEYEKFLKNFHGSSWQERKEYQQQFQELMEKHPRTHAILHQTENCTGNFVTESRNVQESFFIQNGENLKHCFNLYEGSNNCMDYSFAGKRAELIYESCVCVIDVSRLLFCFECRNGCSDLIYCFACAASQNCFGCSGLHNKKYCIFNKQYTKEEYETLVPKIIEHMSKTGEWGEFFPEQLTSMPYNRSRAQLDFPLTKEEAFAQGFTWYEEDIKQFPGAIEASALPDGLPAKSDPIIVKSALSGRPFRITAQEIERYREIQVPLPRLAYDEKMDERARKLGSVKLYERACAKTGKKILTTYPPDSPYIIWDRDEYEREFQ